MRIMRIKDFDVEAIARQEDSYSGDAPEMRQQTIVETECTCRAASGPVELFPAGLFSTVVLALDQHLRRASKAVIWESILRDFLVRYFALLTAIPCGVFSPVKLRYVMKFALITAPVLASYSPTEPNPAG